MSLDLIPDELLVEILNKLEHKQLIELVTVNQRFRRVISDPLCWQPSLTSFFEQNYLKICPDQKTASVKTDPPFEKAAPTVFFYVQHMSRNAVEKIISLFEKSYNKTEYDMLNEFLSLFQKSNLPKIIIAKRVLEYWEKRQISTYSTTRFGSSLLDLFTMTHDQNAIAYLASEKISFRSILRLKRLSQEFDFSERTLRGYSQIINDKLFEEFSSRRDYLLDLRCRTLKLSKGKAGLAITQMSEKIEYMLEIFETETSRKNDPLASAKLSISEVIELSYTFSCAIRTIDLWYKNINEQRLQRHIAGFTYRQ